MPTGGADVYPSSDCRQIREQSASMSIIPQFSFTLGPNEPAIEGGTEQWSRPLPVSRHAFGVRHIRGAFDADVTYGDLFWAAREFLLKNDAAMLGLALREGSNGTLTAEQVTRVVIHLLKHGACYHPACVAVEAAGRTFHFVLNMAVSHEGRELLEKEVRCLRRLSDEMDAPCWPRVFGHGRGRTAAGRPVPMFLGQWLSGFYEFHITGQGNSTADGVVVWDTDHGHRLLTAPQTCELLRQAAHILAYAYNPLTFEAVRQWRHAAGDFVVRIAGDALQVRLISIRDYGPLIQLTAPDMSAVLEAILVMLLATSLQLRLDRLDGTGPLLSFPDAVIPDIWAGFRQGLQDSMAERGLPEALFDAAMAYIAVHDGQTLETMAVELVDRLWANPAEGDLLRGIARDHAHAIAGAIATSPPGP
jgi:hypothetical protein